MTLSVEERRRRYWGINISKETGARLVEYCMKTDRKVAATADRAIREFLDRQNLNQTK